MAKQVNVGTLQKNLKKSIYKRYLMNNETYGLKLQPTLEIAGKLSAMSWVVVQLTLLKPDHMCSLEDYKPWCYDDETAALIYKDILNVRQWPPGYPYDTMPITQEIFDLCKQIEGYTMTMVRDIFDMVTVQVAVVFKSREEIDEPKRWAREHKKYCKEVLDTTPKELDEKARFFAGEKGEKGLWFIED